ncbi:MAG: sulfotransferase [Planctomycetota bacterium]|nr:MAG: sulfotransferase [Planctomycetota bacterium]
MNPPPRPDFVIIGAMKCATSTLHVQLAAQPGFFMSTPKEPNYFSDDEVFAQGSTWYGSLFAEAKEGDIRGESSTHYTKLPVHAETIARLQEELDGAPVKLIYMMRHPVDRLVSHFIHEWTQGVVSDKIDVALDQHPEMLAYSCYAMQLKPWVDAFGKEAILPLFADGLRAHPQRTLQRVCDFLSYEGTPKWNDSQGDQNVSAVRMRKSSARDLASIPALRWLRRTLVPKSWRTKVKSRWVMTERPELSAASLSKVEQKFDQDLTQLEAWFGFELNCANWKSVTAETEPQWVKE